MNNLLDVNRSILQKQDHAKVNSYTTPLDVTRCPGAGT